ncbi:MAG: DUF2125 domain-containing protein [Rhodobacteraceae bacterium]|jgi:hypothetical protein|nr:DUF2125 domain-containing protein [Paracoccaceae bacterium]
MRWLLGAVVVACTLWGGYWFAGAAALKRAAGEAFAGAAAGGLRATHAGLAVNGFPNRFDLTATAPELAHPLAGIGWSAPFFQVLALSYQPNHVIAVWPASQVVELAGERVEVTSGQMRASLVVTPGTALALDRTAFVAEEVELSGAGGWRARLADVRLALRAAPGDGARYDLGVALIGLAPGAGLRDRLDPGQRLPAAAEAVALDVEIALDAPLDRHALQGPPPRPRRIVLREARAVWGGMALTASGSLHIGLDGLAEGRIDIAADDWEGLLALAVRAGLVAERVAPTYARALAAMDEGSADGRLEVPLVMSGGRMRLGPLVLGPAPRL